jgi:hypothetical protein
MGKAASVHEVPCHHNLATYLDAWIEAAGIADDKKGSLFPALRKATLKTHRRDQMG